MVPGPVATVRLIVSPLPVLAPVSTLPKVSSTFTTKLVSAVPAVPVAGGSVVKTTLAGAAGLIVMAPDVAVVIDRLPSLAVRV